MRVKSHTVPREKEGNLTWKSAAHVERRKCGFNFRQAIGTMGNNIGQEVSRELNNSSHGTEFITRLDHASRGMVSSHATLAFDHAR